jgi:hypothetical protein
MKPDTRSAGGPDFSLVFGGNAFEAPPRTAHQRPRPRRQLRRTLRALLAWLLMPSPFGRRR